MRLKPGKYMAAALFFSLSLSLSLSAQSVIFVKAIDLKKGGEKKNIGSFLLGKKERPEIRPGSFCFLGSRLLAVTDAVNGAVVILERSGTVKKRITRFKGRGFVSPVSCCSDDAGNLYVSDSARYMVLKFDKKFRFKKIFIAYPESRITGIFFSGGMFYCVDTPGHRVLCFDRDGKLKFTFGKRGSGVGEFNFPTHIAVDNRFIYVTDAMNFRVQVFDRTGKFIRGFGRMGRGGGHFSKPKGLAVDVQQRIYVADAMFDNVQIFDFNGRFLYYFGGPGHGNGEFWMPSDILVDSENLVWVADTYNSRIQVFKLVSPHTPTDIKQTARRAIKRSDQTFSKGGWHPQPIRPPAFPPPHVVGPPEAADKELP